MPQTLYNPDLWLESLSRALQDYVANAFNSTLYQVEMSFPDTVNMAKETPLRKVLIHLEQDDEEDPTMGFGEPGKEVYTKTSIDPAPETGTVLLHEAAMHLVNYDVGVWSSAETGGETTRMRAQRVLKTLFVGNSAKLRAKATMGGVEIVSFNGGRHLLDRINDVPVWRAMDMTLVVRVFSRRIPEPVEAEDAVLAFDQDQNLTIDPGDLPVEIP